MMRFGGLDGHIARIKSVRRGAVLHVPAYRLFAVITVLFGGVFVFLVPPLWGLDEISHFNRVYHITEGKITPQKGDKDHYGGFIPTHLAELDKHVYTDLTNNSGKPASGRADVDSVREYGRLLAADFNAEQERSIATAEYSPVAYAGALIGAFAAKIIDGNIGVYIYLSRIASLLFYVAVGMLSLYLLRNFKVKWLFFTILLFPVCVFQAAVISADSTAMALAVLLMAAFFRLATNDKKTKRQTGVLFGVMAAAAILLPLTKSNYALLSFATLLAPLVAFGTLHIRIIIKLFVVAAAAVMAFVWSRIASVTSASPYTQRQDGVLIVPGDQIAFLLDNPLRLVTATLKSVVNDSDSYLQSMATSLGWNSVPVSYVVGVLLVVALCVAVSYVKPDLARLKRRLLLLNCIVGIAAFGVFAALYIGFTPTGHGTVDGIQGRYFLPLLIPILMLVAAYVPVKKIEFTQPVGVICVILAGLALCISIIYCGLVYY